MDAPSPRHRPYIPNQIILSGPPGRIEAMLAKTDAGLSQALRLLTQASFTLSAPGGREQRPMTGRPPEPETRELRLYRLEGDESQLLDALLSHRRGFADVIIERNYLTRAIPWTGGGSPWTGGGSPWTGRGSPWTAGGSPWTVGSGVWTDMSGSGGDFIRRRAERIFREQWAFGPDGVNARGILNAPTGDDDDGKDVVVGVFDTSPFPVSFTSVSLEMPPAPLTLTLRHPIPGGAPGGCGRGLANHGFFVAGLIHALAPAADIQLIRVLDDTAQGTLFSLVTALYQFMSSLPEGQRAVINLSLGFQGSDEEGAVDWDGPDLLRDVLQRAYERNIVTVAAAGNENDGGNEDIPAEFPARWKFVVAVAACDSKKRRACFSNQGDVMAPGGNGLKNCQSPAGRWHDGDCPYAVISLDVGAFTGYSYGIGTSFAAPMVAGLAARLQGRLGALAAGGPGAGGDQVRELILASAAADGVIKVA